MCLVNFELFYSALSVMLSYFYFWFKIENTEFSKENETIETIDTIVAADGSLVVEDVLLENISVEEKFFDEKSSTAEAIQVEKLQSQEIEHSTEDSFYKNRKRTWISNVSLY